MTQATDNTGESLPTPPTNVPSTSAVPEPTQAHASAPDVHHPTVAEEVSPSPGPGPGPGETGNTVPSDITANNPDDGIQDDAHVEVDTQSDADSSYDYEGSISSSTSISSSILNYTYENGRRYHAYRSGEYLLPNDEAEQNRLDLKHHVFKLVLGGRLFCAPIDDNPQRILDVGTGTGLWAIETADEFPSAEVTGIDLSPIQPHFVPPNCKFLVDNAEDEWVYSSKFDFIHWRVLASSISDWPKLFSQAYAGVREGGWVEAQEHDVRIESDDGTVADAPELANFFRLIDQASVRNGKMMDEVADKQKVWMQEAGFVDIHDQVYKVPIGRWPKDKRLKEIGMYYQAQCLDAVEPISMALFTRVLGYSYEEAQVMMVGPRRDMKNPNVHVYMKFHFVYGRKPFAGEVGY